MSDDNKLCLLLLNQLGNSVDTSSNYWSAVSRLVSLTGNPGLGSSSQSLLLGLPGLWSVLIHQLEQLGSCNEQNKWLPLPLCPYI